MEGDSHIQPDSAAMTAGQNNNVGLGRKSSNASSASNASGSTSTGSEDDTSNSQQISIGAKRSPDGCSDSTKAKAAYLRNVDAFVQKVRNDLATILKQKTVYDRVFVLLVYWKKSDVKHIKKRAQELERCFKEGFEFETEPFLLTAENKDRKFNRRLSEIVDMLSQKDKNNLFILYYSGHGWYDDQASQGGKCFWRPKKHSEDDDSLIWSDFEKPVRYADCDVLYIFDCCFGLAMIEGPDQGGSGGWKRRCEILSSAGLVEQAGGEEENSFTTALTSELNHIKDTAGMSAEVLGALLSTRKKRNQHKLMATPAWHMWSSNKWKSNIVLAKKLETTTGDEHDEDSDAQPRALKVNDLSELEGVTDTTVLIAISFENPLRLPVAEEWSRWFQNRPANIASIELELLTTVLSKVVLNSDYESNSNLALVTIPSWLWNRMTSHPAIKKVGVVRTHNLMPPQYSGGLPLYVPPFGELPVSLAFKLKSKDIDTDLPSQNISLVKSTYGQEQAARVNTVSSAIDLPASLKRSKPPFQITPKFDDGSKQLASPEIPEPQESPRPKSPSVQESKVSPAPQTPPSEKTLKVPLPPERPVLPSQDDEITPAPPKYGTQARMADIAHEIMYATLGLPGISPTIKRKLIRWAQRARRRVQIRSPVASPNVPNIITPTKTPSLQSNQSDSSINRSSKLARLFRRGKSKSKPKPLPAKPSPPPIPTIPQMSTGTGGNFMSVFQMSDASLQQEEDLWMSLVGHRTRNCPQLVSF